MVECLKEDEILEANGERHLPICPASCRDVVGVVTCQMLHCIYIVSLFVRTTVVIFESMRPTFLITARV